MFKCKFCEFISSTVSENANHMRWKHCKEDTSSKFLIKVSCLECKSETTVQSLKAHISKHHTMEQHQKIGNCLQCDKDLFTSKKFCSLSCATTYNNARKDYSKIKPGPKPGFKPKYTKIKQCEVCEKFHPGSGRSCSKKCKSSILSMAANKRIDNGWNPQENRCRSKPSFLEKSFEEWLISINHSNYIRNKTFRCGKKIYYGDFFFPNKNILIELDGNQHQESIDYDRLRDQHIKDYYNVSTIRITYKEYMEKSKIDIILTAIK